MLPVDNVRYVRSVLDILLPYFSLGLCLQLPVTVMRFFLVEEMGLGPASLAIFTAIVAAPWTVKPVIAFISDNLVSRIVPRNRQVAVAYAAAGTAWLSLGLTNDPGLSLVTFFAFLGSLATSFADVVQDATMVRTVNRDSRHAGGRLQSFVLAARALGALSGSFLSGWFTLFSQPFLFIGLLHLVGVLSALFLRSVNGGRRVHRSTCEACKTVVKALCSSERLRFIALLFLLAVPISDFAILQYFLQVRKKVPAMIFATSDALAYVATIGASLSFNAFFRAVDATRLIMLTQVVAIFFLAINLLLVNEYLHMDPSGYLLFLKLVGSFFGHIGFMPLAVRAADLVPDGQDGTFYSLYMSCLNFGTVVSEALTGVVSRTLAVNDSLGNTSLFYLLVVIMNAVVLFLLHLNPLK